MIKVVITGASGFVGRYLTTYLEQLGVCVIPVSRRKYPGIHHVNDYSQSPIGDVLIHLAEEPDRAKVNALSENYKLKASNLVKLLAEHPRQKIIYASSGIVYGNNHSIPCRTDMLVHATDTYSESKLLNEKIVLDSGGTVVRLSNLFGAGMAATNVMTDIINQIPGVSPIKVRDDKPVCDFLHVSDAVSAFGHLLENSYSGVLNVGTGIGTSIREVAQILLAAANQKERKIVSTQPSLKKSINILDISETKEILDWIPSSSIEERLSQLLSNGENLTHD